MTISLEPGFYSVRSVRWGDPNAWTVAEWRINQRVPWAEGLRGAWFIIDREGPSPFVTFTEIGKKIEIP